jgi:hypothetical protein
MLEEKKAILEISMNEKNGEIQPFQSGYLYLNIKNSMAPAATSLMMV